MGGHGVKYINSGQDVYKPRTGIIMCKNPGKGVYKPLNTGGQGVQYIHTVYINLGHG